MDLIIEKEIQGKTTTLYLKGNLDITTTSHVNTYLKELEVGIKQLIFDLSALEFLDSTGIGSIINAINMAQERNFKIKFTGLNEMTNQVFEMVGIYTILEAVQGEDA